MQNYHRHSFYSNILTVADSAVSNESYAKRAKELGHKVLSSVEHGWQGYYHQTYELSKKYNLKCVIGTEAYWVKNRLEQDKSNHHIIILAKSNKGREAINDSLSEANISGYYYRPRLDLELLLNLPAQDVFITSACIVFDGYSDIDDIILTLYEKFQNNFSLEIQYHETKKQKKWNKHLLELHNKYGINLIVGLDSHYIFPEDSKERDYLLDARDIHHPEEEGWYMDYPSDEEVINRFKQQNIIPDDVVKNAMSLSDQLTEFCDYDSVRIFTKDIKLPTLYPNETKEEKDARYSKLITKKFKEYMKNIPESEYQKYFEGVKEEVQTYKDTGMVDYPLLDYTIVKDAIEHGCLITDTGRGSAVGYFTNTLCGFSKIDRFKSAIKLYPERFISTTRILETHSLPDLDLNTGTPEILEESQKRILGEDHAIPMIAFGTLRKKSAFKIYARSQNMDFSLANEITKQINKYDEAVKYAEEDEKDDINLFDYVDEQYSDYIRKSEKYWGIISDKKKAPSAYLLYQGDIRKEIGLIKCKSESTKKEYITCVIDGAIAEDYKFLKNDILKVDVVLLIDKVFKRIGIEHFDVNTLISKVSGDQAVWDIYAKGYTVGINQIEKEGSRNKCMNYKPHNVSELSAFVAAIRPGFKSMYDRFERRENFSWGIPTLDNLLRTEELPVSFLFFQEQVMSVLNFAGFPMDVCYGIIKSIAKKHPEKVKPLKEKFIEGFKNKLIDTEELSESDAQDNAEKVWTIINDNCGYGFNSSHAFCMACDSLYQAWQKAHYPYEFYEVLLQHYADKGNKDKVTKLKNEMKQAFGIKDGLYRFEYDHRKFVSDKNHHIISPALSSIKGISNKVAEDLCKLRNNHYTSFIDILEDLKGTCINSKQLDILIKINFFETYGKINELLSQLELFNKLYNRKEYKITDLNKIDVPLATAQIYSQKCTEKKLMAIDWKGLLQEAIKHMKPTKTTILDIMRYENEYLGYIQTIQPKASDEYYFVQKLSGYNNNILTLYQIKTGIVSNIKKRCKKEVKEGDIIKVPSLVYDFKWKKDENDNWVRCEEREYVIKDFAFVT